MTHNGQPSASITYTWFESLSHTTVRSKIAEAEQCHKNKFILLGIENICIRSCGILIDPRK